MEKDHFHSVNAGNPLSNMGKVPTFPWFFWASLLYHDSSAASWDNRRMWWMYVSWNCVCVCVYPPYERGYHIGDVNARFMTPWFAWKSRMAREISTCGLVGQLQVKKICVWHWEKQHQIVSTPEEDGAGSLPRLGHPRSWILGHSTAVPCSAPHRWAVDTAYPYTSPIGNTLPWSPWTFSFPQLWPLPLWLALPVSFITSSQSHGGWIGEHSVNFVGSNTRTSTSIK